MKAVVTQPSMASMCLKFYIATATWLTNNVSEDDTTLLDMVTTIGDTIDCDIATSDDLPNINNDMSDVSDITINEVKHLKNTTQLSESTLTTESTSRVPTMVRYIPQYLVSNITMFITSLPILNRADILEVSIVKVVIEIHPCKS